MGLMRRCLDCNDLSPNSRCDRCARGAQARRQQRRPRSAADSLRSRIKAQGGADCYLCGLTFAAEHIEVDHVLELADGGLDEPGNIAPACIRCHRVKTTEAAKLRRTNGHTPL